MQHWHKRGPISGLGEQGKKGIYFRETRELRGQFWGTENRKSGILIFREQGNKAIYFRQTREQVAPYWDGLIKCCLSFISSRIAIPERKPAGQSEPHRGCSTTVE